MLDFSVCELGQKVAPLARESVRRALRAASSADDLFHAAIDSEEIGATAEAERLYRRALELEPDHPTARFNLGVVLEDRGATAEAIQQYVEAVRLGPRVGDVHFNLARLYQQTGNQQAALRHFSRFRALTRGRLD